MATVSTGAKVGQTKFPHWRMMQGEGNLDVQADRSKVWNIINSFGLGLKNCRDVDTIKQSRYCTQLQDLVALSLKQNFKQELGMSLHLWESCADVQIALHISNHTEVHPEYLGSKRWGIRDSFPKWKITPKIDELMTSSQKDRL